MRPSARFLALLAAEAALACALATHAALARRAAAPAEERTREVVRRFQLTDLALFNEARYTRHLSQADRHAAFQDHPGSLEHFPSGTLAAPPLRRRAGPGRAPAEGAR